jgi:hypothetical protein
MKETPDHRIVIITGIIGILAAILVGTGEFLLHYSPDADYADDGNYVYLLQVSEWRITTGHFLGVIGAPFYLIGFWHIYLGLKPFGKIIPYLVFESISDASKAMSEITNAVCEGEITPNEGQTLSVMIENYRKVVETVDLESRIAVLEAERGKRGDKV